MIGEESENMGEDWRKICEDMHFLGEGLAGGMG